jgi:hypothetical protein
MSWFKKISMPTYDVYHGTGNYDSIYNNNFSYAYMGNGLDEYGPGFYFINDEDAAARYVGSGSSPGVIKARVNLSKPFKMNGLSGGNFSERFPSMNRQQVSRALSHSLSLFGDDFLSNWGEVEHEGREVVINTVIRQYTSNPIMIVIYDFFKQSTEEGYKFVRNELGYDGIVVSFNGGIQIIVAWFPDQISIVNR